MHWHDKAIAEIDERAPALHTGHSNTPIELNEEDYPEVMALSKRKIKSLFGVYLPPGSWCSPHCHTEDVLIIMLHNHPTRLFVEDEAVETCRFLEVFVPGDVRHHVERNETQQPRYTLAVMYC